MSQNDISNDEFSMEMERIYMNSMQVMVNLLDPNKVVVEAARTSGKTSEVTVNRIVRVADSMPAELSFLAHRTYVALLTNIWPNIQAAFSAPCAGTFPSKRTELHAIPYYSTHTECGQEPIFGHNRSNRL